MIRKTLTIVSLIGLLLSVGLWGASSRQLLRLTCGSKKDGWGIEIGKGKLEILRLEQVIPWSGGRTIDTSGSNLVDYEFVEFSVRLPALAIISGGILICCIVPLHRRRRKRKKLGLCLKCGYDLRASKDRCPECGDEIGSTGVEG